MATPPSGYPPEYTAVKRRSGGWCEAPGCRSRASDHHHHFHSRISPVLRNLPETIWHLCRRHHDVAHGKVRPRHEGEATMVEEMGWAVVWRTLGRLRIAVSLPNGTLPLDERPLPGYHPIDVMRAVERLGGGILATRIETPPSEPIHLVLPTGKG